MSTQFFKIFYIFICKCFLSWAYVIFSFCRPTFSWCFGSIQFFSSADPLLYDVLGLYKKSSYKGPFLLFNMYPLRRFLRIDPIHLFRKFLFGSFSRIGPPEIFADKKDPDGFPPRSIELLINFSNNVELFKVNFSAFSFKFSFEFFSFCFRASFFNNLWSSVNNFFSFFEAKTCCFTNDFDNFNFRCTSVY